MSNVLSEEKKQQVIALGRLGWSLRRIQRATGVRRETAAGYLRAAGIEPRPPGGSKRPAAAPAKPATQVTTDFGARSAVAEPVPDFDPAKPAIEVTTDSEAVKPAMDAAVTTDCSPPAPASRPTRSPTASACEPYREAIEIGLGRGRNAVAIWQDLVTDYGFPGAYQSVRRFIRKFLGTQSPEARVVIETAPGEEAQVDYGSGPMARDPASGKYRRMRIFVLTLGYSRKSVRLLVFHSSARAWAELHEKPFRRLGGAPSRDFPPPRPGEGKL